MYCVCKLIDYIVIEKFWYWFLNESLLNWECRLVLWIVNKIKYKENMYVLIVVILSYIFMEWIYIICVIKWDLV